MTDQQRPTTPSSIPDEQVKKWHEQYQTSFGLLKTDYFDFIRLKAAQWGWQQRDATVPQELQEAADQHLEDCCNWLDGYKSEGWADEQMRADLRPEPVSLKKQALNLLQPEGTSARVLNEDQLNTIRRALESLPE